MTCLNCTMPNSDLQDAGSSEIKKAYRKKTLVLHPDKNEAPDAEEKFRKVGLN